MGHGCSKSGREGGRGGAADNEERGGGGGMGGAASIIKKKEAFSSQSSPHGYRTRIQSYHCDNNNSTTAAAMEMSTGDLLRRIETLEQELKCKDNEIKSLNNLVKQMPEFSRIEGDVCFRAFGQRQAVLIQSYKPSFLSDRRRQIEDLCRDLVLNNDHISQMEASIRRAIDRGLSKRTHARASVKCFPTYVRQLPTGSESGKFLALDLGGTNFRVVLMDIEGRDKFEMDNEIFPISKQLMEGPGEDLFDYIAKCLFEFAKSRNIDHMVLPLGFTFSFPCRQKGLAVGELITWTKGFKCSGVEGEDVGALLTKAIQKRGDIKVEVCAILNDTTGCLMSCAWKEPNCRIGLIIGTGINACYLENLDNVELWDEECTGEPRHVVINTEWGAFGDHGELDFILTKWDKRVDKGSINPGKQIFEKMISGMYMGEVVRQVLVDLVEEGLIFATKDTSNVFRRGRFFTKYVSEIESDQVGSFDRCREALADFGIDDVTDEDCSALRHVCESVSRRAAFMAAAGITALLKKMDYRDVVVAIDGSVFRFHPHFPNIMRSRISQLMGIDYKFDLMLSTDGSGRGAALVAAVLTGQCKV